MREREGDRRQRGAEEEEEERSLYLPGARAERESEKGSSPLPTASASPAPASPPGRTEQSPAACAAPSPGSALRTPEMGTLLVHEHKDTVSVAKLPAVPRGNRFLSRSGVRVARGEAWRGGERDGERCMLTHSRHASIRGRMRRKRRLPSAPHEIAATPRSI